MARAACGRHGEMSWRHHFEQCSLSRRLWTSSVIARAADLRTVAILLGATALLPLVPGYPGIACPLRTLTGVPCPLCGVSTSVQATFRLRIDEALSSNPAGIFAVAAVIVLLMLRPPRVTIPTPVVIGALAAMWVFQLFRFSLL